MELMAETFSGEQQTEFMPPLIDNVAESISPERQAELTDIFDAHANIIGKAVTAKGMRDLYEDVLHIDHFDPIVINDFFEPGFDVDLESLQLEMKSYFADKEGYDLSIDDLDELPAGDALKHYILDLFSFFEELIDFIEGERFNHTIKMRIDHVVSEFDLDEPQLHEDLEIGIIGNFNVGKPATYYAFKSFTQDNPNPAAPDVATDEHIENVEIKSNQLVIVGTRLYSIQEDKPGLVKQSIPHGVWDGGKSASEGTKYSRMRFIMYQNLPEDN